LPGNGQNAVSKAAYRVLADKDKFLDFHMASISWIVRIIHKIDVNCCNFKKKIVVRELASLAP
jgi:hypothetical protein